MMDKENMTENLTEEQLDSLVKVMAENNCPDRDKLNTIHDALESGTNPEESLAEMNAEVEADRKALEDTFTEEESRQLAKVILRYKSGEDFSIYKELPESMKVIVRNIAMANNMDITKFNAISRVLLDEFITDKEGDEIFEEFEKQFKDATMMPGVTDMYLDHIKEVMTVNTIKLADEVAEKEPEKAEQLRNVSKAFTDSYTFERMYNTFDTVTRVRKAIRREWDNPKKFTEEINFTNRKSIFKCMNANDLITALKIAIIDTPVYLYSEEELIKSPENVKYDKETDSYLVTDKETGEVDVVKFDNDEVLEELETTDNEETTTGDNVSSASEIYDIKKINELLSVYKDEVFTEKDIAKFIILMAKTCESYDTSKADDASYVYYQVKNLITLSQGEEAKTPFAAELICNIKKMMMYIRKKEEEFNEANKDNPSNKKHK